MTRDEFVEYLQNQLIPDLMDSGHEATADDFKVAVHFIMQAKTDLATANEAVYDE